MVSTEVELTEEQMARLRKVSEETGKSMSELVRLGVDFYLSSRKDVRERAKNAAGRFASGPDGPHDVSENHDKYLAEAFHDW
jgi:hypothetical protein